VLCLSLTGHRADICKPCIDDLPWLVNPCAYCALPMETVVNEARPQPLCQRCHSKKPPFSAILAGFEYRFPIDHLIHAFKDHNNFAAGHLLTQLALVRIISQLPTIEGNEIIVPVPTHWKTRRRRGFNQSEFIAGHLARLLRLELKQPLVQRRATSPQKRLSKRERHTNLRHAFSAEAPLRHRILLVDDVVTTGATADTITTLLIDSGAEDVIVLALARTPSAAGMPV
jgi:ComF family protein